MTDRELLEAAAKAAGIELTGADRAAWLNKSSYGWNPLHDDGDALRLAVKLSLQVDVEISYGDTTVIPGGVFKSHRGDPLAATRRAIVRAAAEMGRNMK
jgi:hypothetical protein